MSSDDTNPQRVSTDLLQKLITRVHTDDLTGWDRNPYTPDIGEATIRDTLFGKLGLPVVLNGEVIHGGHIVEAERAEPKDNGELLVVDVTPLGWTKQTLERYAVGETTAGLQLDVNQDQLTAMLAEWATEDIDLLLGTGYDGDDLDTLLTEPPDTLIPDTATADVTCPNCDHTFTP